jgi:hypothetical protein
MASFVTFALDQGSDFEAQIQAKDSLGAVRNLTGYTFRGQVRRNYQASSKTDFTITVIDASVGLFTMSLTAAQTAVLKDGRYVFDIEIVAPSTKVTRILEGTITVYPEVTR